MIVRRKRRWRSAPSKAGKKKIILLVLVLTMIFSLQTFIFIEKNLRPPLMSLAKVRLQQIASQAINKAVSQQIAQGTNLDKLVDWKMDTSGKISGFMLNYTEHAKIASGTVAVVQSTLNDLSKMGERIPLGQALGSAILASFGPDVPVRLVPQGSVNIDLNTRQKDAGINMILVEVYIRITAKVAIIIPFDTESEIVSTEIPISYLLVVGDVPMYYFDGKGKPVGETPPTVSLPNITVPQKDKSDDTTAAPETTSQTQ